MNTGVTCHQVLVIDDHDDTRDVFKAMLQAAGFDVSATWSAYAAYQEMRRGFCPCVALIDLHMPGMDGFAFLDRIRIEPHLATVPVVFVSGDADEEAEARRRGCDFLLKPIERRDFIAAVDRHCHRHCALAAHA
jgi:CheY-like chemotaxis protein